MHACLQRKEIDVLMTRYDDRYVALDERTAHARAHDADFFVSIHANACSNPAVSGVETYTLNHDLFAVSHDSTTTEQVHRARAVFHDLCTKSNESADVIHRSIIDTLKKQQYPVTDRRVRKAVSQVLLGADVPAALIEVGFLSNRQEALRLSDEQYLNDLAHGICTGIHTALQQPEEG